MAEETNEKENIGNHSDGKINNEDDHSTKSNSVRTSEISTGSQSRTRNKNMDSFILICVIGATIGVALEIALNKFDKVKTVSSQTPSKYWVFGPGKDVDNENGILKHVHLVLNRVGYEKGTNQSSWKLLWAHSYPFRQLSPSINRLKSAQIVNHFPGTGFITNKVDLATTDMRYIPKAFKLPQNREAFLDYARKNEDALFLQKDNQHRGVILKNVSSIDLTSGNSFVQEYIQKPFLVDGHKFDIGVYVVLTSVNPLRAYWYKGDVLFRYCPRKYYPFDPNDLDKYLIGDDYLPTWEVPSLAHTYTGLGYGMKDSFDAYVKSQGKDPNVMWREVQNAIAEVLVKKEHHIVEALKRYQRAHFFELMRFDLIVDEALRVYLLEANMSPNLSSAHFPPNQLLYEQVLYSLLSVTGVASYLRADRIPNSDAEAAQRMTSSEKDVATWAAECASVCRSDCGGAERPVCAVCRLCLPRAVRSSLLTAHYEHLHRADFRRLYPPTMTPVSSPDEVILDNLTEANRLQMLWYQGKCNNDITWCS